MDIVSFGAKPVLKDYPFTRIIIKKEGVSYRHEFLPSQFEVHPSSPCIGDASLLNPVVAVDFTEVKFCDYTQLGTDFCVFRPLAFLRWFKSIPITM